MAIASMKPEGTLKKGSSLPTPTALC
jgi:hypothetical protein